MNIINLKNQDVEDPEAMIAALESIKEWIRGREALNSDASMSIRENPHNFLVRFHIPTIELSNTDIDSFSGSILKDDSFASLFLAKLWLNTARGELNVYRSIDGGTCIDAILNTDSKLRDMQAELEFYNEVLGPNHFHTKPTLLNTFFDCWMTLFRLIKVSFKHQASKSL